MSKKVSELAELVAAPDQDDLLYIVDTSEPSSTSSKKIKASNLLSAARGLRESGGTTLAMGAVADGGLLARVGSAFVSMLGWAWTEATRVLTLAVASPSSAGTPPTPGLVLANTTDADGTTRMQPSPRLTFSGSAHRTTGSPNVQPIGFDVWLQGRAGSSTVHPQLVFAGTRDGVRQNGLAFANFGPFSGTFLTGLDGTASYGVDGDVGWCGIGPVNGSGSFGFLQTPVRFLWFSPQTCL